MPFPDELSRKALLKIGNAFLGSSDWYENLWQQLDKLQDKRWLILWGTKDLFLSTQYLNKRKAGLENAKVIEYECGHFVQEEKTDDAIAAISSFIKD